MCNFMNLARVVSIFTLGMEPLSTGSAANPKLTLLLRVRHKVGGLMICIPMFYRYNILIKLQAWERLRVQTLKSELRL